MGERTSYRPGTFSWVDLSTTDPAGAKRFYEGLFGWNSEDTPAGGGTYTMFRLDGKDVGAGSEQSEQERSQGIPPHWNSYITVDDVDARAEEVPKLGGSVVLEPFDVLDIGRMAVISDPAGAVVSLWQPKTHIGAGLVNAPGTLCWNELHTTDVDKAKDFYTTLLGWATEDLGGGAYTSIRIDGHTNGGMMRQGEQELGVPPHWLVYFAVADCDDGASRAGELGGKAIVPPTDVPLADGRIAVIADPQGAVFGLFSGQLDP